VGLFSTNTNGGNVVIRDGRIIGGYSDPAVAEAIAQQKKREAHDKKVRENKSKARKKEQLEKKRARSAKSDPKKNQDNKKKGWW
jgi:hypothetical protein